jgi:Arylsulfotransferase (ASST)
VGGPKKGWLWDGTFQEVDVETGKLLFQWRASEHLPFNEAYRSREGHGTRSSDPWDFFHINSIDKDEKGNFLISSRYYFSLTYIDGRSGDIIWKLGGKDNMFKDLSDGAATNMSWQHHARWREGGKSITLFDNSGRGAGAPIHPSRGLWIDVDQQNMTAKVRGQYWNPTPISSQSQGSVQLLDNGNVFVGYGFNAAWTEYKPDGEPVCEVHMGPEKHFDQGHIISYRAFKYPWVGKPTTKPDWVVPDKKGSTGYVSWNGATEVKTWILQGSNADEPEKQTESVAFLAAIPKTGFETTISIPERNTYTQLRVVGLDKSGNRLGASKFAEVESNDPATDDSGDSDGSGVSDASDDTTSDDKHASDKRMLQFIFFLVGFLTCAITCGVLIASRWAITAYYFRRQNGSSEKGNWWDNLRFGRVKSTDDDDIEDLTSEMNELIAAHADEFELGDDESEGDVEEQRAEEGEREDKI